MRINSQKFSYIFLLVSTVSIASEFKPLKKIFDVTWPSKVTEIIYSDFRTIHMNQVGSYEEQLNNGCVFTKNGLDAEIYTNAAGQEVYRKTSIGVVTEDGDTKEFRKQFLYFNPNQLLVKIEEPSARQIKKADDARFSYEKIFDVINNKSLCKGFKCSPNFSCDNYKNECLIITENNDNKLKFIQSLGNDASPINKAIGHAVDLSRAINYEWTLVNLLEWCVKKNISINKVEGLNSLSNLRDNLSSDQYIDHLKTKNEPYYKLVEKAFDVEEIYSLWHINNIVFLDNYKMESPKELLEYVKLHTHIKQLRMFNNHSFVMIIKQAKGDPFQVLVFRVGDKINILTTQAVNHYFEKFMITLFGQDLETNKLLENKIMRLEIDNHKNLACLADVLKVLGINKEFF